MTSRSWLSRGRVLLLACALALAAVIGPLLGPVGSPRESLRGNGSSFINPLMERWAGELAKEGLDLEYMSCGSAMSLRDLALGKSDFASVDVFPAEAWQNARSDPKKFICVPLTIGAVVPVYNLPGVKQPLRFSGRVLADIYLGKLKRWNEAPLVELNPGVALPDVELTPVYRGDPSGASYLWTAYLSESSPEWKRKVGTSTLPKWPTGRGSRYALGISGEVRNIRGGLGYVEMTVVLARSPEDERQCGMIRNKRGKFVVASLETATEAARSAFDAGQGAMSSLIDAPGMNAYPICGFPWAVVPLDSPPEKRAALAHFFRYALHEGQQAAPAKLYAPLPENIVRRAESDLLLLTRNP